MACSQVLLPFFFDPTVLQEQPRTMKKSTGENREFGSSLDSGETDLGSSQHQGRSGYVKYTVFESLFFLATF